MRAKFDDAVSELFQHLDHQDESEIYQDDTILLLNSAAGRSTRDPEHGKIACMIIKKIVSQKCPNIPSELIQRLEEALNTITEDGRKKEKNV